jgi:CYTH domain-containing protein
MADDPPVPATVEIERKFLVDRVPPGLEAHPARRIRQGYLAIHEDGTEVRVRRTDGEATMTVKSGPAHVRVEEELEIDGRRFDALWALTEGRRVSKTRHLVPAGDDLVVELDVYDDALAGLMTAEVEFPSESASAAWMPPAWLGAEVTGDERYANQSLATRGRP